MLTLSGVVGKTYGVFGLGKTGQAAAKALLAGGAQVYAWDDKPEHIVTLQQGLPDVQCVPFTEWPWSKLSALILSPGVPLYFPQPHAVVQRARKQGVSIHGDSDLLSDACPYADYIGITGTNGKSTTTSLIGHVLSQLGVRVQVGGNLGTPVLSFEPLGKGEAYVLEMSSYQLDLMQRTRFNIAVHLNFSPDHLDRHGSMENYIAAKTRIFDRQTSADTAIIAVDDAASEALCSTILARKTSRVIPISAVQSVQNGVYVVNNILHCSISGREATADLSHIRSLQGQHNGQNAAAAYAACVAYGLQHDRIIAAMQNFPGLAHRMEWLGETRGVQFVNDSKATNADAAAKALRTYDDIFWIAGGVQKAEGIAPLASYFPKIRHTYLIGEATENFANTLEGRVLYTSAGTLENAVEHAARDAEAFAANAGKTAVVLLSPACASFDQFANFEARGAAFVAQVKAWRERVC